MHSTIVARRVRLAVGSGVGVVVDGATGHPDGRGDEEPHRHRWTTLVCRPRVVEHPPLLPGPCAPPMGELAGIDFELWNLPAEAYPWLHVHRQQVLEASVWHDPAPHPATTGKVASLTLHAVRLRILSLTTGWAASPDATPAAVSAPRSSSTGSRSPRP